MLRRICGYAAITSVAGIQARAKVHISREARDRTRGARTVSKFSVVVLLLLVGSCESTPPKPEPATTPQATPVLQPTPTAVVRIDETQPYRWLHGIPCTSPCIEGITPGITKPGEAWNALRENPAIVRSSVRSKFADRLTWTWKGGLSAGVAYYDESTPDPIYGVEAVFGHPFALSEVAAAFGPPTYVIAVPQDDPDHQGLAMLNLALVYLSQGLLLYYDGSDLPRRVDYELTFTRLAFFAPTNVEGFEAWAVRMGMASNIAYAPLVAWQGSQAYSFYCRELRETRAKCP